MLCAQADEHEPAAHESTVAGFLVQDAPNLVEGPVRGHGQPLVVLIDVLVDFFSVDNSSQGGEVMRLATTWDARQVLCGLMPLTTALLAHKATIRAARIPLLVPVLWS